MLPPRCGSCLTFSTLSTPPCSYNLPLDAFFGGPVSPPQDPAVLAAEELCAIALGEDVRFMILMTGGSYLGRIIVETPTVVGQRWKGCAGAKGGEGMVRKVMEYVKDGNGWKVISTKGTVLDSGKRMGGARVGGSRRMDGEVSQWTRPVAVVFGNCKEHGVTMEVVVKELN